MSETTPQPPLLKLAAQIVAAYASHNHVTPEELLLVIGRVYGTLASAGEAPAQETASREPAVPVKRSVFPDHIICLEDGKKLTMLKRHLKTAYGMTPDQYRERWGLPPSYPMVAPNYAVRRSVLAKNIGLGHKRSVNQAPTTAKRGRQPATTTAE